MGGDFPIEALLLKIGFDWVGGNQPEQWVLERPPLSLGVVKAANQDGVPSLHFVGNCDTPRTISHIQFSLNQTADSPDQALALLAYYLRDLPVGVRPDWVAEGLALKAQLPWMKESK